MRYCHYCNTLLHDGDTYCYVCGASQGVPEQSCEPYYDSQQIGNVPPVSVSRPYTPPPIPPAPRPAYASSAPRQQIHRPYQPPMPPSQPAAYPCPGQPWRGYYNPQPPVSHAPAPDYTPHDSGYPRSSYQPYTYGNSVPRPLSGEGADTMQGLIIGGVITAIVLGLISIVLLLRLDENRVVTSTGEYSDTIEVVEEPQLITVDPYPGK